MGYEGLYEVSNLGRVARTNGYHCRKRHFMKEFLINSGYTAVRLCKNHKPKTELIHRMVAMAFILNPNNYPQVNHKDENKLNNFVYVNKDGSIDQEKSNLEWCTGKYNSNYGNWSKKQSESHIRNLANCKKAKKVICVETGEVYLSVREIERKFGFCHSHISKCCRQKTIGHGFHWEYI